MNVADGNERPSSEPIVEIIGGSMVDAEGNKSVNDKPFHQTPLCRPDWCGREPEEGWLGHYPRIDSLAPRGDADEAHSTRLCGPSWCGHPNHLTADGPYRVHDPRSVAPSNDDCLTPAERLEGMIARGELDPADLIAAHESKRVVLVEPGDVLILGNLGDTMSQAGVQDMKEATTRIEQLTGITFLGCARPVTISTTSEALFGLLDYCRTEAAKKYAGAGYAIEAARQTYNELAAKIEAIIEGEKR